MRFWFWVCLLIGVAGAQVFLWFTTIPLGIPGEWIWHRILVEPDTAWNLLGLAAAAILYILFVEAGSRRIQKLSPSRFRTLELAGWLTALVAVSFTWLWLVQECAPTRNRLGKSAFVLYYHGSSGYFTRARYESPDPQKFLEGYEGLMREGDVLHVGTHPPGLFLAFHGMISICQQSTLLAGFLDATQPASFREACDVIAQNAARKAGRPLLPLDRRVLWLATLLVLVSAACAVIPLFALVATTHDFTTAWRIAALWPAVPAVAVFIPKSDVVYSLVGLLIVCSWLASTRRQSPALGLLTGLLAWCGLMMSLAFLPVLLFTALIGWNLPRQTNDSLPDDSNRSLLKGWIQGRPPWQCVVSGMAGFLIPTLLMGWCFRINLFVVWWLNYRNHAGFYAQFPRTYWRWLLENPIELAFAAGWPVAFLALSAIVCACWQKRLWNQPRVFAVVLVWGALWLTGKNSSEAARLWIVFLPWLVWLAADYFSAKDRDESRWWNRSATVAARGKRGQTLSGHTISNSNRLPSKGSDPFYHGLLVLMLQLITSALTVARVSGFDL